MKSSAFDVSELDVEAFAKQASQLAGEWTLQELPRLADSVVIDAASNAPLVSWHARGELRVPRGNPPQVWLHVTGSAHVKLECQRCLKPVETDLSIARSFWFVHGEKTAAELDSESEDDVLALSRALDVKILIEDELLLALPLVPRHEACPQPLALPSDTLPQDAPANPFAVLATLKKRGGLPN